VPKNSSSPLRSPSSARRRNDTARRARELVASFGAAESAHPTDVFEALSELDALPVDDVRAALAETTGPQPDVDRLDTPTRFALGIPLRPLRLRTLSVTTDADVLDLGPVAEEQLRLAGKTWDGVDRAPEERLDGELEDSFAGTLKRLVLGDADAPGDPPRFDVLLFAEDSGVVFAAGTTHVVALIAYRKVELRDRRTRIAIEEALATLGDPEAHVAEATIPEIVVPEAVAPPTKKARSKKPAKTRAAKKNAARVAKPAKKRAVAAKRTTR
jgi:hypothetical protein